MHRAPVESSRIAAVGYDADARILEVQFKPRKDGSSSVWAYRNVTAEEYDALRKAPSVGKFFGANIKGAKPESHVANVAANGDELRLFG